MPEIRNGRWGKFRAYSPTAKCIWLTVAGDASSPSYSDTDASELVFFLTLDECSAPTFQNAGNLIANRRHVVGPLFI